jgi:geranylgeranyl diphosphate synthase type II
MGGSQRSVDATLAEYLRDCRDLVLGELRRIIPSESPEASILYDLMLTYPLRAAKALRPAICIATCRALGGRLEVVLPSAAVLELYHNAFLIHDDVEDLSEKRRDEPTLHQSWGMSIAVNVGDAMLALALSPLLENMKLVGMGKALRILQAVAAMARESAEGQAIELAWIRDGRFDQRDQDYERMVEKKTSHYSFITPMTVGAVAAGESAECIDALGAFARPLGIAFQIQDDVLNLAADEARYGKEIAGDLWEGKRTLILLHAVRVAPPEDRERALAILARPRPRDARSLDGLARLGATLDALSASGALSAEAESRLRDDVAALRRSAPGGEKTAGDVAFLSSLIARTGSVDYARGVARARATEAKAALATLRPWLRPSVHLDFLEALTDYVLQRDR